MMFRDLEEPSKVQKATLKIYEAKIESLPTSYPRVGLCEPATSKNTSFSEEQRENTVKHAKHLHH